MSLDAMCGRAVGIIRNKVELVVQRVHAGFQRIYGIKFVRARGRRRVVRSKCCVVRTGVLRAGTAPALVDNTDLVIPRSREGNVND